jgi:hypothetical protein
MYVFSLTNIFERQKFRGADGDGSGTISIRRERSQYYGKLIPETHLQKIPRGVTAVSDFCLEIRDTEFIIFVGPPVAVNRPPCV